MREVFVDTSYWVGVANPLDWLAPRVSELEPSLAGVQLVTTQEVPVELLGFVSGLGSIMRIRAVSIARAAQESRGTLILPQTTQSFRRGLDLYAARLDKGYSLVDCISMVVMRERGISEALTSDRHFEQEGFAALLRP